MSNFREILEKFLIDTGKILHYYKPQSNAYKIFEKLLSIFEEI